MCKFTRTGWLVLWIVVLSVMLSTACDIPGPEGPATFTPVPFSVLAASPTVAPVVPTARQLDSSNVGVDQFTPGAPPLSAGTVVSTITPTPAPTEAMLPMTFIASDGRAMAATFYTAVRRPAPTLVLLHMLGGNKEAWRIVAIQLQDAGYNVIAVDLRGYGETGGQADWSKAPGDVVTVLNTLRTLPSVDPARLSVIGVSIGANVGLVACAESQACKSVILISPGLDYLGVRTADAMKKLGPRAVYLIASQDDKPAGADTQALNKLATGDHGVQLYPGSAHGMALFTTQPSLTTSIVNWLARH